ncbi:Spc98 family-domain-containing protein [Xylariaceae sp. FL0255]|nr:Spc98 family-domain-containing protein [Xylariaceae sp. FL0255]
MSSRLSQYTERRTNGTPESDNQRPRRPGATSRASQAESRNGRSPQPNLTNPAHKRLALGHARPTSRTLDERRTERLTITTREKLITRTKSPTKEAPQPERWRSKDVPRPAQVADTKPNDVTQTHWDPVASIIKHSSAPLAIRVSTPPSAYQIPPPQPPQPLHELSLEAQEAAIIEDLLFVFMGYEGQFIRYSKSYNPRDERDRLQGPNFKLSPGLDPSLQDLTNSMLLMATQYSALEMFVNVQSREEFGIVNHALCAAIRKLLHDYLVMVAQLETQFLTNEAFTLHLLHVHTLPTSHMMAQLYALASDLLKRNALLDDESEEDSDVEDYDNIIENLKRGGDLVPGNMTGKKVCKGGTVIDLITKRLESMSGDPAARSLLTFLLRDTSRPYMAMLNEWLHHGEIKDPHSEFLIKEQKSIRRDMLEQDYTDDYWDRRYVIQKQNIPPQLESVKDKVLLAGKYLNVVRECGGVDVSKVVGDLPTSFDDPRFLDNVNNAYAYANESLMKLLLTTHALPSRLQSLKHYFFLDPSDYFTYFLELSASELRKNVKAVNTVKLQSLLDLVLRQPGSIVSLDPFKEDVHVEMNEVSLIKMLQRVVNITGIEQGESLQPLSNRPVEDEKQIGYTSFQLDYHVPFPVSLVISRKTVWRYQALFRYLLSLRYAESQLSGAWQAHGQSISWNHKSSVRDLEIWKRRIWTLRARMVVFVQQLLYFCTLEVIEPNWQSLLSTLKAKDGSLDGSGKPDRTVDELMKDHVDFLDTCLKGCMLTNGKLIRIHSKLMSTCLMFATYTNWLSRELEKTDPDLIGPIKPPNMSDKQWKRFQLTKQYRPTSAESAANSTLREEKELIQNLFEIVKKWEMNFSRHLQILLDALNHYAATETVVLLSLCARLATANQGTEYAGLRNEEEI